MAEMLKVSHGTKEIQQRCRFQAQHPLHGLEPGRLAEDWGEPNTHPCSPLIRSHAPLSTLNDAIRREPHFWVYPSSTLHPNFQGGEEENLF